MTLSEKIVLVTGSGGGIGRAVCLRLAADGAQVAVTDLNPDLAQTIANDIKHEGGSARSYKADVTDSSEVLDVVGQILKDFGRIDILVNNAGGSAGLINKLSRFKDADEETWSWVIDLNLHGTMRFVHSVLPCMVEQKYGKIINIASIAATIGILDRVDYSAAKAGVIGMTKALAMEVGIYGITVNAVSPGLISRTSETMPTDGTYVGRNGRREEVASLVAFLASAEADFITGVNYIVDGGRSLGPTGI